MKLIDADKLLQETWSVEIKDMFHMTETVEVVSAIDIKESPTINAIPIEWIEEWVDMLKERSYRSYQVLMPALFEMLADWEEENEK